MYCRLTRGCAQQYLVLGGLGPAQAQMRMWVLGGDAGGFPGVLGPAIARFVMATMTVCPAASRAPASVSGDTTSQCVPGGSLTAGPGLSTTPSSGPPPAPMDAQHVHHGTVLARPCMSSKLQTGACDMHAMRQSACSHALGFSEKESAACQRAWMVECGCSPSAEASCSTSTAFSGSGGNALFILATTRLREILYNP